MNVFNRLPAIALMVISAASFPTAAAQSPQNPASGLPAARQALAAGRAADALREVEPLLAQAPGNPDVVEVTVLASLAAGDSARAYAAYDGFVRATGQQAAGLLKPIAVRELWNVASNAAYDPRLRTEALERLARDGDGGAGDELRRVGAQRGGREPLLADAALARLGDQAAAMRLTERASLRDDPDKVAVAEAICQSGAHRDAPLLLPLLRHEDPATRIAALEALAALGRTDAIPAMRPLVSDPYLDVRARAALALTRLGDPAGREIVAAMLRSPVPDVRLRALDADPSIPRGERSAAIRAVVDNPDPLTRVKAAEMLARDEPEAARPVLMKLTVEADSMPRREAARILEKLPPPDVAAFRRLLSDSNDWVRMYAAGGVLHAASTK